MTWRPTRRGTAREDRRHRLDGVAALAVAGAVLLGACGGDGGTVDVLAASSFTDVAGELEPLLERELGVDVRFSFGSSGSFYDQMEQGSPAAVVITANEATMRRMEEAALVAPSVAIASNELIVVTSDTPAGRSIRSLDDLTDPSVVVVVCASSAPCGAATDELLERRGIDLDPASREPNVRATLTKVVLGEADAAIVYRTDARSSPEVRSVEIDGDNVSVTSRAASRPEDPTGARVVEVLAGADARELLRDAGFGSP